MKKLFAFIAALAFSAAAHATPYKFTWQGDYGSEGANNVVTGSFEGTANGNLISNLSNISVSINGVAYKGNGSLYGSSYNNYWGWTSGGAQASFDGSENNFLFIDVDYPNSYNYTNYFYSVYNGNSSYASNGNNWNHYQYVGSQVTASNWSVTEADVPEPAELALFGLGLAALAYVRGKKKA